MAFAQGTSQEQQLISLINQKRVRLGLSPLRVDAALRQASALRARELDERYSVNRPDKRWGLSVLKDMGLLNVKAQAFISKNTSPLQFVLGWTNDVPVFWPHMDAIGVAYHQQEGNVYGHVIVADLQEEEGPSGYFGMADALAFKALSQTGQTNGTIYSKIEGAQWCASFISWCARQVDIGEEIIPRTGSSTLMYTRLLEQGAHIVDVPARGDLVFYKDFDKPGTFAHVGIMLGSRDTALMEDG